jgi:fructose-specific phosphotransferase system IIC component
MKNVAIAVVMLAAALGGMLLAAANRWGASSTAPCRDTIVTVIPACAVPQSPWWTLLIAALVPASVVAGGAVLWFRRARDRT